MAIKELRQSHNLTQQQLADIIGCPKRTIENWESGSRECKPYILNLIAHYLNTANWKETTTMTTIRTIINEYRTKGITDVEIWAHNNYSGKRFHPEHMTQIPVDYMAGETLDRFLDYRFDSNHIDTDIISREEYLSRWDIGGYLDADDVADSTLFIYLDLEAVDSYYEEYDFNLLNFDY